MLALYSIPHVYVPETCAEEYFVLLNVENPN
jgi:hypothetical protein